MMLMTTLKVMLMRHAILSLWLAFFTACAVATPVAPTPTSTPTRTALPTATATLVPTATATPNSAAAFSIEALRARAYPGGPIEIVRTLEDTPQFTRYLVAYRSDGLRITAMMNRPKGAGPFPVIILNHGYWPPAAYTTGTGTQPEADFLARRGYLTIAPDYRNYGGSDQGDDVMRVSYLIDVVNLVASVKSLPYAQAEAIGMWGHSMGGGITLKALVVSPQIKAASLYGAMSGDEAKNFAKIRVWRGSPLPEIVDRIGTPETNPQGWAQMSPLNYLRYVQAPVIIHHGQADATVPIDFSEELVQALQAAGKPVEYHTYPGQPHLFFGAGWASFMERTAAFFDRYLRK